MEPGKSGGRKDEDVGTGGPRLVRVSRTIRPDKKGWEKILGKTPGEAHAQGGNDAGQEGQPNAPAQEQPSPSEASPSTAPAANLANLTRSNYPIQFRTDVIEHLYEMLKGKGLPNLLSIQALSQPFQNVEEPLAYAHATLLENMFGPEGFDITNSAGKFPTDEYRCFSSLQANPVSLAKVRNYVTALLGHEALMELSASQIAEAGLESMIEIGSLPKYFPNSRGLKFAEMFKSRVSCKEPFNSAYFIVMEMQPPSTRLLVAKALEAAYADGSLAAPALQTFPTDTFDYFFFCLKLTPRVERSRAYLKIPNQALQREAQKLGVNDTAPHAAAYEKAWGSLVERLHEKLIGL
ncbi:hypothetical protein HYV85_05880 [Candidatus Woesearchaeota archaeon]|nr:hypothetical protein [Candidatus Woesearchaeota archaeon]